MFGISIDSPERQSALIQNLMLPFPLLSDPDREAAIRPYGFADEGDERSIARPGVVVVTCDGTEAFRTESRDYADRPTEDTVIDAVAALGLPPTTQGPPTLGPAEPGPSAFRFNEMVPYYRGARFAAIAMGRRFPDSMGEAKSYVAQLDRYIEAAKVLYRAKQ